MNIKTAVDRFIDEYGNSSTPNHELNIYKLRYMKEVKLENMTLALATMHLGKSSLITELIGDFEQSFIDTENEDKREVFLDYYNTNKEEFVDSLKKCCKLTVSTVRDLMDSDKSTFAPARVHSGLHTLIYNLNREPIPDVWALDNALSLIEYLARMEYLEKREDEHTTIRQVGEFETVNLFELLDKMDTLANRVSVPYDTPNKDITNSWIRIQARMHLIIMYLSGIRSSCKKDLDRRCPALDSFIANIPSKTPEGMISIEKDKVYPTILSEFFESPMLDMDMYEYLALVKRSYVTQ